MNKRELAIRKKQRKMRMMIFFSFMVGMLCGMLSQTALAGQATLETAAASLTAAVLMLIGVVGAFTFAVIIGIAKAAFKDHG